MFPVMTADLDDAITGTAAGVPFVALPPAGPLLAVPGRLPMIAAWHPTAAPGSPAAMAAAIPLAGVPAWRVYFGLPGTGSRQPAGRGEDRDLLLDGYAPMVEQAAAEFPAARAALRSDLPIDDGPVAVMGGSAGGHVALLVLTGGTVPVAAAALINPAVRAESVVLVNEGFHNFSYRWTGQARAKAAALDTVAAAGAVGAAVLLVTGEHEYPEFRPDQDALLAALGGPTRHVTIPGMDHTFAEEPGLGPAPQTPHAVAAEHAISAWLTKYFTGKG
jgi:alpha-beta hydrolase superfamily lysophospholipase